MDATDFPTPIPTSDRLEQNLMNVVAGLSSDEFDDLAEPEDDELREAA